MGILPRVVVDARMVGEHGHGIANYVLDLAYGMAELRSAGKLTYDLIFLVHNKRGHHLQLGNFPTFNTTFPFLHPLENWEIPETLTRLRADLYHSPSFSSLPFCPCPYIQTIHDLNHLQYGGFFKRFYYHTLLKRFARNARKIMTVSEFSRGEIARWLKKPTEEIAVVENAIRVPILEKAAGVSEAVVREHGLVHGKYFYTLSSMKPHKNLRFLVRAYQSFRKKSGGNPWPLVLPVREHSFRGEGVVCLGQQPNEAAMQLLKHAGAFVFPSLYEGFGRPPLEAASLGVPILVSDIPPHREGLSGISPDCYRILPAKDGKAWQDAFSQAMAGALPRPDASARSWVAETYSVKNLTQKMDAIYKSTIRRFEG